MELNLVVLAGRLAAEPELRTFESGTKLLRLLVTVRSTEPRSRLDVIPVVLWDPDEELVDQQGVRGQSVWVAGAIQRRFWSPEGGSRSRIEIVAHEVTYRDDAANLGDEDALAS